MIHVFKDFPEAVEGLHRYTDHNDILVERNFESPINETLTFFIASPFAYKNKLFKPKTYGFIWSLDGPLICQSIEYNYFSIPELVQAMEDKQAEFQKGSLIKLKPVYYVTKEPKQLLARKFKKSEFEELDDLLTKLTFAKLF
ncbi:MAG: hypothetical protein ABIF40_05065 [archaeon]